MACPGKPFHRFGDQRADLQAAGDAGGDQPGGGGARSAHECRQSLIEIGQRGGEAPGAEARGERAQPGQRQFCLHAAFGREQFVPFIHDNSINRGEHFGSSVE